MLRLAAWPPCHLGMSHLLHGSLGPIGSDEICQCSRELCKIVRVSRLWQRIIGRDFPRCLSILVQPDPLSHASVNTGPGPHPHVTCHMAESDWNHSGTYKHNSLSSMLPLVLCDLCPGHPLCGLRDDLLLSHDCTVLPAVREDLQAHGQGRTLCAG